MPPSSAALSQLKLIVTRLLLKTAWADREQGHRQGLATISDGLREGMGGGVGRRDGGLMCHGTAVTLHTLSHKHIFVAAKRHLHYLNASLSHPPTLPSLEEFCTGCLNLSLSAARPARSWTEVVLLRIRVLFPVCRGPAVETQGRFCLVIDGVARRGAVVVPCACHAERSPEQVEGRLHVWAIWKDRLSCRCKD